MKVIEIEHGGGVRLAILPDHAEDIAKLKEVAGRYGLVRSVDGAWLLPLGPVTFGSSTGVTSGGGGGGGGGGAVTIVQTHRPRAGDTVFYRFMNKGTEPRCRPAVIIRTIIGSDSPCDLHVYFLPEDDDGFTGYIRSAVLRFDGPTCGSGAIHCRWSPRSI